MDKIRPSKMIINKQHFIHNIHTIRQLLLPGTEIMPVVKASGYGTYTHQLVDIYEQEGIAYLGVAIVDEGISFRKSGYTDHIVIINQPYAEDIPFLLEHNLTPCISLIEFAKELNQAAAKNDIIFPVHLEVDTGMGRTGVSNEEFREFAEEISILPNLQVEGISTHFACSDCDSEFTQKQIKRFEPCVSMSKKLFSATLKHIHCCNSAGIIDFPEAHYNMVRPGLILNGYLPNPTLSDKIDLKPIVELQSKISYIKKVPAGTTISYGCRFTTERPSVIATIPLGYHDGVPRLLTNNGFVSIHGQRMPIVGTICMDSFMVDVTDLKGHIAIGDTVFIWDNQVVTLEEIAERCQTINYEILCTISERVPRAFI